MKRLFLIFILMWLSGTVTAQNHKVSGKVLDETGAGFPGAAINVKGTNIGTVTDVDGNFSLNAPDNSVNILVIRGLGYITQEVNAGTSPVTVRLASASRQLQGAVVTALAVRRERRELGYSSTTLNNQELTVANNTSVLSSLQGKVPGANITSSTSGPGGSTRIVLRGEKSLTGNNNALIIVDGIITNNYDRTLANELTQVDFGNSANDIDPEDVESVTVLEGPAAAALYGSVGANGAVLITTKSGANRKKKMEVMYKATYTMEDVLKYPTLQHQYGQGNIYLVPDDRRENFSWGLPFNGQLRPWGQNINGQQLVKPYSDQPDNIKSFFDKGKVLSNYVSLGGGNDTSSYFLSLNAVNSTGIVPNTFYNKYSIRFNGTTKLGNNFYSTLSLNYINTYSRVENTGQSSGSVLDALYQTARDIPVWEMKNYNNVFYSQNVLDTGGVARYGNYGAYAKNPYWVADNYDNRNRTDRVLGSLTIGYKKNSVDIFDRVGVDFSSDRSTYITPKLNVIPFDPFYSGNPFVNNGGYQESDLNFLQFNNDAIITYTKQLSDDLGMTLLGGQNIRLLQSRSLTSTIDPVTNGLVIPNFYNFQNAVGPINVTTNQYDRRYIGAYGDLKLSYRRQLYLEMTARNDWASSLYPDVNQPANYSYFYPSVNASWVFTENRKGNFFENILNYGKVRAGYASVGNDAPPYRNNASPGYQQTNIPGGFGSLTIFPFNGQPGYQIGTVIPNPELRPERTNEYETGVDLSFLRGRLTASFTYYRDLSFDQITPVPVAPSSGGFASQYVNIGDVLNTGTEYALRGTPVLTHSGFRWDLFGTYTKNNNTVVSLTNGLSQITVGGFQGMSIVAAVGRPYGAFYSIDLLRNDKGQVVVDPKTGLPLTTTQTVYKGTYQPKFIASWGTDLSYRGLSLHVLFVTKQGGVFYSRDKQNLDFNGTSAESANRTPQVWANSVIQTGPNTYAPNTVKYRPYDYYTTTEQNVAGPNIVDASYVKLQEASLYYTIPQRLYKRSAFGTLSAGVFGSNLFIWTAKSNQYDDPEASSAGTGNGQGFNFSARPSLRNYGITLKATF